MDQLLKLNKVSTAFWAVDKVVLAYFAFTTVLLVGWWRQIPDAWFYMTWHVIAIGVLIYQVKLPNRTTWVFRNWYMLFYVASCYKEMAVYIPVVRRASADQWLSGLDYRIWGVYPTVWLERMASRPLTELLQVCYTLFIPVVLLVAALLWRKRLYREFQYYAFLIALGFLISYVGYFIVPALGPRFLLKHLQHTMLQGMWFFHGMQVTLDRLESVNYDCFPSGHTELTILAWWGSRMVSNRLFKAYFAYTPVLIFATVYLRYHYTVDVLAGAVLAAGLILTAPAIYRKLSKGGVAIGRC